MDSAVSALSQQPSSIFTLLPSRSLVLTRASVIFNNPNKAAMLFPVPVMQCLQVKWMAPSAQEGDRYGLVMSDSGYYVLTVLATQTNRHVYDSKLVCGCFVRGLQSVEKNNAVNIIGVLKEVGEIREITLKKDGRPFQKRDLTIVDDTSYSVRVTVWGKIVNSFNFLPESVIAFKGTKVSDFNGKSLSLLLSGTMSVDPDISDTHRLKKAVCRREDAEKQRMPCPNQ
ncbi:replication factor A-like protein [Ilyonectria robusta]